ncbi:Transmembrane domain-containing protein [Spironucleus salmonicida]|uniref:Transmembrane domain-containing protein n=1 Tax=Spironucleus salmonicida TaxID=348837 RepID=V6LFY7_9EUKA|nr:Transmembrane domain-containing protein [Spironucleus salmonicida]|eukprot:EST43470.1 Transmembrane domain-containing protein [Spironucleus salmonicida]
MNKWLSFFVRAVAGYVLTLLNFPISAAVFYIIFAICNYNAKQFQEIQDVAIITLGITNFYFHIVAAQKMKWLKSVNYFLKYLILTVITASLTVVIFYVDSTIMIRWLHQKMLMLTLKDLYFATVAFASQYFIWNLHWSQDFPIQLLVWYLAGWLVYFLASVLIPIHLLGCILYTLVMKQTIFRFVTLEIWTPRFRIACFAVTLFINFMVCSEMARYFYVRDPAGYLMNVIFYMGHLHIGLTYVSLSFTLEIQKWVLKNRLMIVPYICFCYFWGIQLAFLNFFLYRKVFVPYFLHKFIGPNVLPVDNLYNTVPSGYIARLFFCLIFSEKREEKRCRVVRTKIAKFRESRRCNKQIPNRSDDSIANDVDDAKFIQEQVQDVLAVHPDMLQQFDGTVDLENHQNIQIALETPPIATGESLQESHHE